MWPVALSRAIYQQGKVAELVHFLSCPKLCENPAGGILVGSDGLEYIFDNKSNWNYWSSSIENTAKRQSNKRNQQVGNTEVNFL